MRDAAQLAVRCNHRDGARPLRRIIQNARAVNMPKDKVEAAIKRASGQNATDFQLVLYEGYAPHGVAVLVEAAVRNFVLNQRGIDSTKEFIERQQKLMEDGG